MNTEREEILKVVGLKQYFKSGTGRNKLVNKAVDDISFSIYKGEVFSLVGESGCGKTTTGRTIIKLYQSSGGEVYFHGTRIVSDVKAAKEAYQLKMDQINEGKLRETAEIKELFDAGRLSQEDYKSRQEAMMQRYSDEAKDAQEIYRQAKRDRRFETIKDAEGMKAKNQLHTFPQYQDILDRYVRYDAETKEAIKSYSEKVNKQKEALNLVAQSGDKEQIKLEKAKLQEYTQELKKHEKELKLSELRKKQDIDNLRYSLSHKNRLLMRRMQMIFQDPIASLNPRMTVKEIIAEGLRINGVKNEKEIEERVNLALKTVNLVPEHASRYPHEFSGGQRQRIGIARALVVEPSFIIADEPISSLDVSIRAQIINLLNELRETKGITIMFIAHDLSVVKYFSDRLAVMYYGHIVEMGDKEKVFDNPLHPYTLSLMDSIPLPDPEYEKRRGKTVRYNPAEHHDYSKESPTLREVEPGHFVLCNSEEFERYQAQIKNK